MFTAKLVMACNDMPFTKSTDANVRERFFIIPFNREFKEEERDYGLKQKLENNVEEIFSWAVEGLMRLRARGKFIVPAMFNASMDLFMLENDSVGQWLEECGLIDNERQAKRSELWPEYRDYCKASGCGAYKKWNFFRQLGKKGLTMKRVHPGDWFVEGFKPPSNSADLNNDISWIVAPPLPFNS